MTCKLTPNGTISDKSGLLLATEVSTSQSRKVAGHKLKMFFNNWSVVAGVVLNIDETLPYSLPDNANDWDSTEE